MRRLFEYLYIAKDVKKYTFTYTCFNKIKENYNDVIIPYYDCMDISLHKRFIFRRPNIVIL